MIRICCVLLLLSTQLAYSQNSTFDSLKARLAIENTDLQRLDILHSLAQKYSEVDLVQAATYAKQGMRLSETLGEKEWQPKFYEIGGRAFANQLLLDSASYFFSKAFDGFKAVGNKKGQATTTFKIAWVYKRQGQIDKALEYDLVALKLMEELDDKAGICNAYTRVSYDLTRQERLKEAMAYAEKAIAICEKYNLEEERYYVLNNAGDVYMASNNYQASWENFNKAVNVAKEQSKSLMSLSDVTNSRGNAYKRLGKYKEALADYEAAFAWAKESNYQNALATVHANLGEVNMILGNYKEALVYQLETIRLMEQHKEFSHVIENYKHISNTYEKLHDYPSALRYQKKALMMTDSIGSIESDAAMSKMLTQYETEKKEATIASQQDLISQQKVVQFLGIGLVVVLVGFIVFGFISYRNRTKTNKLLSVKNAENELLLKEIHHRVKNNLEVVSSLLALQSAQIDDPNTKEAMLEGQNRVNSIGIVHQKLYQGENLGAIEMKDYFLNLSESIIDTFGADQRVKLEVAMEKLSVDIDTAVPLGLIVNELLTNTLKYAFPEGQEGKVSIKLEQQSNGMLQLEVADNGTGKIGTTQGTGFGGQLVALLTRQLNGVMREEILNGTRIIFEFKSEKMMARG